MTFFHNDILGNAYRTTPSAASLAAKGIVYGPVLLLVGALGIIENGQSNVAKATMAVGGASMFIGAIIVGILRHINSTEEQQAATAQYSQGLQP
jgi:hypothetical protein